MRICEECGGPSARAWRLWTIRPYPEHHDSGERILCPRCARQIRRSEPATRDEEGLTRRELIGLLDSFFEEAGIFEICARCHDAGTGCCPPCCRVIGERGCDPQNRHGKSLFCATFICAALLNAISECDPEIGRVLRWVKENPGIPEFRVFEMISRAPAAAREDEVPLRLPDRYPAPPGLDHGADIRASLAALADEVLEIRRRWSQSDRDRNL